MSWYPLVICHIILNKVYSFRLLQKYGTITSQELHFKYFQIELLWKTIETNSQFLFQNSLSLFWGVGGVGVYTCSLQDVPDQGLNQAHLSESPDPNRRATRKSPLSFLTRKSIFQMLTPTKKISQCQTIKGHSVKYDRQCYIWIRAYTIESWILWTSLY